ncbi:MAG: methyltransferase domain-containing protein [Candidatus Hodarchaeota archaeon]
MYLHLGCGMDYKPGYINIDKHDTIVADESFDVLSLPYEDNSAHQIEALHLVEHFDTSQVPYFLSECHRVLRPGGFLIIETPDLARSVKKFLKVKDTKRKRLLNWIFGISNAKYAHHTGFSLKHLKNLLRSMGFVNITRKKPVRHSFEPSLCLQAEKKSGDRISLLNAMVRGRITGLFGGDSVEDLFYLENYIFNKTLDESLELLKQKEKEKKIELTTIIRSLAKWSVFHPGIPVIFLESCFKLKILSPENFNLLLEFFKHLEEIEFQRKLESLWLKSRKFPPWEKHWFNRGDVEPIPQEAFQERVENLVFRLALNVCKGGAFNYGVCLEYIASLEESVEITFISFNLLKKGELNFNKGLQQFVKGEHEGAMISFEKAIKYNPQDSLAYWNLSRIYRVLNKPKTGIVSLYKKAFQHTRTRWMQLKLKEEIKDFVRIGGGNQCNQSEPIPRSAHVIKKL